MLFYLNKFSNKYFFSNLGDEKKKIAKRKEKKKEFLNHKKKKRKRRSLYMKGDQRKHSRVYNIKVYPS